MRRPAAVVLALAGLLVLLGPTGVSAATTLPNPESLRATLPDPVDSSWIEVAPGRSGYIDGPVDYDVIRAYYAYYKQSDSFIQEAIDILKQGGFVGGYERQWLRSQGGDLLTEVVYVFATHSGALTSVANSKSADTAAGSVRGDFDTTLGPDATGTKGMLGGNYNTASVDFIRGNADYVVGIGSYKQVSTDVVIAQARVLYSRAPSSIALSHTSTGSVLARNIWLFAIAGFALLLGIATLVAVMTVVLLLPHRRFVPRQGAPLRT